MDTHKIEVDVINAVTGPSAMTVRSRSGSGTRPCAERWG